MLGLFVAARTETFRLGGICAWSPCGRKDRDLSSLFMPLCGRKDRGCLAALSPCGRKDRDLGLRRVSGFRAWSPRGRKDRDLSSSSCLFVAARTEALWPLCLLVAARAETGLP